MNTVTPETQFEVLLATLHRIEQNQIPALNVGTSLSFAIAGSIIYVLGLAINGALEEIFAQIHVDKNQLLGSVLYALVAILLCTLLLLIIYSYLQPALMKKFTLQSI
jgi:hypothetical protein